MNPRSTNEEDFLQADDIVEHLKKSGFEVKQSKDVTLSKVQKAI